MNMPLVLLNRRRRGFTAFSPSTLFALAEPGVWFDPSDLTTLFQDPAGTTPVTTPGQTVGLMLDKSKGLVLGSELVVNGDFASSANWTAQAGWAVSGGKASASASNAAIYQALAGTVNGARYRVTFTVSDYTSGSVYIALRGGQTPNVSSNGTFTALVGPTSGSDANCYVAAASNFTGSIDNISVRELAGNHATQATIAARPTYGIEPVGGRRNNLTYSQEFSNAAWTKSTSPGLTLTDQGSGVWRLQAGAGEWFLTQFLSTSGTNTISFDVKSNGAGLDSFSLMLQGSFVGGNRTATSEWVRYSASGPASGFDGIVRATTNAAIDVLIRFPQLETGSTATAYQRVTTQHDVTEAGVASTSYLAFDGVDDGMVTGTITPGVDKAQVFAGVRKLSDALVGVVAELSASLGTNNGSFMLLAPLAGGASADFVFRSKGTVLSEATSISLAPVSKIVTGLGDISGDRATLRLDGSQVAQSTADQGTGNYLAYPLYIGCRGGTTLPFKGNVYSLITRFGANLDAGVITNTETWVAGKTGIVI